MIQSRAQAPHLHLERRAPSRLSAAQTKAPAGAFPAQIGRVVDSPGSFSPPSIREFHFTTDGQEISRRRHLRARLLREFQLRRREKFLYTYDSLDLWECRQAATVRRFTPDYYTPVCDADHFQCV
jgi:hypothetical protein